MQKLHSCGMQFQKYGYVPSDTNQSVTGRDVNVAKKCEANFFLVSSWKIGAF